MFSKTFCFWIAQCLPHAYGNTLVSFRPPFSPCFPHKKSTLGHPYSALTIVCKHSLPACPACSVRSLKLRGLPGQPIYKSQLLTRAPTGAPAVQPSVPPPALVETVPMVSAGCWGRLDDSIALPPTKHALPLELEAQVTLQSSLFTAASMSPPHSPSAHSLSCFVRTPCSWRVWTFVILSPHLNFQYFSCLMSKKRCLTVALPGLPPWTKLATGSDNSSQCSASAVFFAQPNVLALETVLATLRFLAIAPTSWTGKSPCLGCYRRWPSCQPQRPHPLSLCSCFLVFPSLFTAWRSKPLPYFPALPMSARYICSLGSVSLHTLVLFILPPKMFASPKILLFLTAALK